MAKIAQGVLLEKAITSAYCTFQANLAGRVFRLEKPLILEALCSPLPITR
jgi:hypothetical protein